MIFVLRAAIVYSSLWRTSVKICNSNFLQFALSGEKNKKYFRVGDSFSERSCFLPRRCRENEGIGKFDLEKALKNNVLNHVGSHKRDILLFQS